MLLLLSILSIEVNFKVINEQSKGFDKMPNENVREALDRYGVRLYELADLYGVSETTINRWIRHEMPHRRQNEIIKRIEDYAKSKG